MASNKAPLEKKRVVASLQSLAGAALSFLLIYPEQTLSIWSWLAVLLFALFFFSGWALPTWLFEHPLFDLSCLALTSSLFAFAIRLNPLAPWAILLLYNFLLYAVTLVESYGGGVSVQSELGNGALFTVTLPCLKYPVLLEKPVSSKPLDVKLGGFGSQVKKLRYGAFPAPV